MTTFCTAERLMLRAFDIPDAAGLAAYRNDPDVARYQSWTGFTEAMAIGFIRTMLKQDPLVPGEGYQIAIGLLPAGTLIGDLYLKPLDYDSRQVEIGYTIASAYQGQGYATEAVTALLDYLFLARECHRVVAYTVTANTPSVNLLKRVGFRLEGICRQSIELKGEWQDECLFAMLKSEWRTAS